MPSSGPMTGNKPSSPFGSPTQRAKLRMKSRLRKLRSRSHVHKTTTTATSPSRVVDLSTMSDLGPGNYLSWGDYSSLPDPEQERKAVTVSSSSIQGNVLQPSFSSTASLESAASSWASTTAPSSTISAPAGATLSTSGDYNRILALKAIERESSVLLYDDPAASTDMLVVRGSGSPSRKWGGECGGDGDGGSSCHDDGNVGLSMDGDGGSVAAASVRSAQWEAIESDVRRELHHDDSDQDEDGEHVDSAPVGDGGGGESEILRRTVPDSEKVENEARDGGANSVASIIQQDSSLDLDDDEDATIASIIRRNSSLSKEAIMSSMMVRNTSFGDADDSVSSFRSGREGASRSKAERKGSIIKLNPPPRDIQVKIKSVGVPSSGQFLQRGASFSSLSQLDETRSLDGDDTVGECSIVPTDVGVDAKCPVPIRIFVLLLAPRSRRFELIPVECDASTTSVRDVYDTLVPQCATEKSLKRQKYVGMCRAATASPSLPPVSAAGKDVTFAAPEAMEAAQEMDGALTLLQHGVETNDILIAIPAHENRMETVGEGGDRVKESPQREGKSSHPRQRAEWTLQDCFDMGNVILSNPRVKRLIRRAQAKPPANATSIPSVPEVTTSAAEKEVEEETRSSPDEQTTDDKVSAEGTLPVQSVSIEEPMVTEVARQAQVQVVRTVASGGGGNPSTDAVRQFFCRVWSGSVNLSNPLARACYGLRVVLLAALALSVAALGMYHARIASPLRPGDTMHPGEFRSSCGLPGLLFPERVTGCHPIVLELGTDGVLSCYDGDGGWVDAESEKGNVLWQFSAGMDGEKKKMKVLCQKVRSLLEPLVHGNHYEDMKQRSSQGKEGEEENKLQKASVSIGLNGTVIIQGKEASLKAEQRNGNNAISPWPFAVQPPGIE